MFTSVPMERRRLTTTSRCWSPNPDTCLLYKSYDEAYSYISTLLSIENSKITFLEAPGDMDYRWGGWYFFVDQKEAKQMAQQYFGGGDIAVSATLKPSATPKSHPDYSDHDDVSEDERYTYYQKTPKPKSTDKPEATKRPSSDLSLIHI